MRRLDGAPLGAQGTAAGAHARGPAARTHSPDAPDALAPWRGAGGRLARDEHGLSLVEVLIAVTILTFGLIALASVGMAGLLSLRDSGLRQQATEAAAQALESARDVSYAGLANLSGDANVVGTTYDSDGTACLAAETILRSASGPITGAPFQVGPATPAVGQLTVRTYVTQVAAMDCLGTAPPAPAKRVTVEIRWLNGPTQHLMRKSTMVAMSGRGAGQVVFDIAPLADTVTDVPGVLCLSHTLTNQGVEDSYSITPPPTLPSDVLFTAYDDADFDGEGDTGEEISGSTRAVPFGDTLPLLFCYEIDDVNRSHALVVLVESNRNDTVEVSVTDTINTVDELLLYLHTECVTSAAQPTCPSPANQGHHRRDVGTTEELPMDREFPAALATQPAASFYGVYNYDTDIEGLLSYGGMLLPRVLDLSEPQPLSGDVNDWTSDYHGRWEYQFPRLLRLNGTGEIRVWLAPTTAFVIDPPWPGIPVAVRYRLYHVIKSPYSETLIAESDPAQLVEGVPGLPGVSPYYLHEDAGWEEAAWGFTINGPVPIARHEYLRLELVCDFLLTTESCHLGFDTPGTAAYLKVGLS